MMMPANFSAVAENELTYVVGGATLVDYLAPAMKAENWQNVSTNIVKIIGNTYLTNTLDAAMTSLFDGHYVPGDLIGGMFKTITNAYTKGSQTLPKGDWGFALGVVNAGVQVVGLLSSIYTLGSGSIGIEYKKGDYSNGTSAGLFGDPAAYGAF